MRHPLSRAVALAGLVVLSPLLAGAAVAIKLSSRGPVVYRADRIGLSGRPFTMFKLRTMHHGSGEGPAITGGGDDRVSALGRGLRRLKLDELPQLVNVVRGDMAIIGPRPEAASIVAEHYTPAMRRTLEVLPGLSSPASLQYYAHERSLPDDPHAAEQLYVSSLLPRKLALELVYVDNRSLSYDAQLAVRTVAALVGCWNLFPQRQRWERDEADRLLHSEFGVLPVEPAR